MARSGTDIEAFRRLCSQVDRMPAEDAVLAAYAYVASLGRAEIDDLIATVPALVGELHGAPPGVRYRANRQRILVARDSAFDPTRRAALDELLRPTGPDGAERQFLSFSDHGAGRLVEVIGDLATARQTAILTPGTGNGIDNYRISQDRGQLIRAESGPRTAMVVWLGYDAPPKVSAAMGRQRAIAGADGLHRTVEALRLDLPPGTPISSLAVSYGTVLVEEAALRGTHFNRLGFFGSPGMRAKSAADFDAEFVGAARANGEYVTYTQWHGSDPATLAGVVRMATGGADVRGHHSYFRVGSESLRNAGRVVRGDLEAITEADTTPAAESRLIAGLSWAGPLRTGAAGVGLVYDRLGRRGLVDPRRPTEGMDR